MDHLWRHTKREALGDRETVTIDGSALAACQYIIDLSPTGPAPPGRDLVGGLLADEVASLCKDLGS